jgi:hypothetical protein
MVQFIDLSWDEYERFTMLDLNFPKGRKTMPIDHKLIKTEMKTNTYGIVSLIEIKDGMTYVTKYGKDNRLKVQPAPWL